LLFYLTFLFFFLFGNYTWSFYYYHGVMMGRQNSFFFPSFSCHSKTIPFLYS